MAKEYIAKEESVQEVNTKVGSTTDSVGSTSQGSVMAKLNKIISDVGTHMNRWTNARAERIDANISSRATPTDVSDALTTKIGSGVDTALTSTYADTDTLFGRLRYLVDTVVGANSTAGTGTTKGQDVTTSNTLHQKLNKISTYQIGTYNEAYTNADATKGNVMGKLNWLITNLGSVQTNGVPVSTIEGKIIKSVQRGSTSVLGNGSTSTATLSPAVNVNKSFVISTCYGQNVGTNGAIASSELTNSTTLTFRGSSTSTSNTMYVKWQVIEFY